MVHLGAGGAFLAEAVLTFLFVLIVSQLWLFIVAPLVGGVVAALLALFLYGRETESAEETTNEVPRTA